MPSLTMKPVSNETKEKNCVDCQQLFTLPKWGLAGYEIRCPDCLVLKKEAESKEVANAQNASWLAICPKSFQDTDIARLPCQEEVRRALDWQLGPIGLLLHGPTGTGKSRTAWLVLKNQHLKRVGFKILNSSSALQYAAKFGDSATVVEKWIQGFIDVDVLFMDDLFKNKFTDSFEGVIFSIIDRRTENGRPIILTANDTGATLKGRMTEDRGEPLVRRLREFCLALTFKLSPPIHHEI